MYSETAPGAKKRRILIAAGGAIVLIIVVALTSSLLFGGDDELAIQKLKLAQQHTEITRLSEIGTKQAKAQDTRNQAITAKLIMQSSEDQIIAIAKKGQSLSSSQIAGGKDTKTDTALQTAEQNNRFDEAFLEALYGQLKTYQQTLKKTQSLITSTQDKQTLNDLHEQISKLLPRAS